MTIAAKVKKLIEDGKIEEANALINEHVESEVKGLKDKNTELLGSLKKLKEENKTFNDRLEKLEDEKEAIEAEKNSKSGDIKKITEDLEKKHKKEMEKLTIQLNEKDGEITAKTKLLNTHVVGEGLTAALVKAKVKPEFMAAAKAVIQAETQAEVVDENGKPIAKFNGKAVEEFVTGWAQTDAGKHFVAADSNSGGGSNGANGSGKASTNTKTMKHSEFNAMSYGERSKASIEGVTLVEG
jgi:hypothetical protein